MSKIDLEALEELATRALIASNTSEANATVVAAGLAGVATTGERTFEPSLRFVEAQLEPDPDERARGLDAARQLAAEIGLPEDSGFEAAARAVAKAMTGMGFETRANTDDHMLVTTFCPFGDTAANHPEIVCKLDQGIVTGLMAAANQTPLAIVTPHQDAAGDCVTDV